MGGLTGAYADAHQLFEDVITQNDAFTALIKTWLGRQRLQGNAAIEGKRLLSVLQDTTLAMEAIETVKTKNHRCPRQPRPSPAHSHIEDTPYITQGLDLQIDLSTSVLDN